MKIAFVNGKGGVGKSTLCFLTALGLREAGKSVSVEDLDPQKSISAWINGDRDGIEKDGGEFALIDTRPAIDDESVHDAISRADRVILPCTPSPGDLTAAKASLAVVKKYRKRRGKVCSSLSTASVQEQISRKTLQKSWSNSALRFSNRRCQTGSAFNEQF